MSCCERTSTGLFRTKCKKPSEWNSPVGQGLVRWPPWLTGRRCPITPTRERRQRPTPASTRDIRSRICINLYRMAELHKTLVHRYSWSVPSCSVITVHSWRNRQRQRPLPRSIHAESFDPSGRDVESGVARKTGSGAVKLDPSCLPVHDRVLDQPARLVEDVHPLSAALWKHLEKRSDWAPRDPLEALTAAPVDDRCRVRAAVGLAEHRQAYDVAFPSRDSSPRLGPLSRRSRTGAADIDGAPRWLRRWPTEPADQRRSHDGVQDDISQPHRRSLSCSASSSSRSRSWSSSWSCGS